MLTTLYSAATKTQQNLPKYPLKSWKTTTWRMDMQIHKKKTTKNTTMKQQKGKKKNPKFVSNGKKRQMFKPLSPGACGWPEISRAHSNDQHSLQATPWPVMAKYPSPIFTNPLPIVTPIVAALLCNWKPGWCAFRCVKCTVGIPADTVGITEDWKILSRFFLVYYKELYSIRALLACTGPWHI